MPPKTEQQKQLDMLAEMEQREQSAVHAVPPVTDYGTISSDIIKKKAQAMEAAMTPAEQRSLWNQRHRMRTQGK